MLTSQPLAASSRARHALDGKIGVCCGDADRYAGEIVATALVRSFTTAQVVSLGESTAVDGSLAIVWINPPDEAHAELARLMRSGGKVIVCGRIGPRVAETLGLQWRGPIDLPPEWAECRPNAALHHDESPAAVRYSDTHPLAAQAPLRHRSLCRFDFAEEWNNLGYGRIALSGDAWSLQSAAEIGEAVPVARLVTPETDRLVYAALRDTVSGAALWFNRPVGPVDSLEWRIVELFLSDYRADDLPCFPCVSEIPAGYRGAVCARLDCDEAVSSARPLVELYRAHQKPLSLALLTGQTIDDADMRVLREAIAGGGSVVPHSEHHYPNWGGSYERARAEAMQSRLWFDQRLPEATPVRYAVSPFHQNPPYAVAALADSGYEGFVGGTIASDPQYLLGRAGRVPLAPRPIVSLSTQCMLHGDCYRRYGGSIDVYCESFEQHLAAGASFGYLDHPFSDRYQYGWTDESTRIDAHRRLIEHVGRQSDIWWASVVSVLDFLRRRDAARIAVDQAGCLSIDASGEAGGPPLAVQWKGRQIVA